MAVEREPIFYTNAIPIDKAALVKIKDMAHTEWIHSIMPKDMDHKDWLALTYIRALERFLLSKGCKLQFKVEIR